MKESGGVKKISKFLRFEYVEGSLDDKTRELVLFASAVVAGCSH